MIRRVTFGVLVLSAITGGMLGDAVQRADEALTMSQLDVAGALSQMATTASEINGAQQAYVAPGQPDQPWLARVGELVQQFAQSGAAIRPQLRSPEAAGHLQTLTGAVDALVAVDGRIRTHLAEGQELSASDLIFTEARDIAGLMVSTIRALESTERATTDAERAALARRGWVLLATVAIVWAGGVVILVRGQSATAGRVPTTTPSGSVAAPWHDEARPAEASFHPTPVGADVDVQPGFAAAATDASLEANTALDLGAAAAVCVDLSRLTSVDALPDLLARAAVVLDASGLILWMGAGGELFAVSAYGYDPRVLARLGPISRHANNATAAAWRSGEVATVTGDMVSNGAIVAPIMGVNGCIGVLAVEIRRQREADPGVAAVTTMFAAQLATIVAAWPAPSEAPAADQDPPIAASL